MDNSRFDQLTRYFGGSRRQALRVPALVLLGTLVPTLSPGTVAARDRQTAQGPCGNGGPRANRCRRHRDCCTGYCNKKIGRCRCRQRGQTCRNHRSCCSGRGQALTCQRQGSTQRCLPSAPPPPPVDCDATLTGAGCEFLAGPGVWDCGSQDLTGVNLTGCDLANASFFSTNASAVNFTNVDLTGANFFDANVTGAVWSATTCPSGTHSDDSSNTCCGHFILGQTPTGCPG